MLLFQEQILNTTFTRFTLRHANGPAACITSRLRSLIVSDRKYRGGTDDPTAAAVLARVPDVGRHRGRAGGDVSDPPGHDHCTVRGGRAVRRARPHRRRLHVPAARPAV